MGDRKGRSHILSGERMASLCAHLRREGSLTYLVHLHTYILTYLLTCAHLRVAKERGLTHLLSALTYILTYLLTCAHLRVAKERGLTHLLSALTYILTYLLTCAHLRVAKERGLRFWQLLASLASVFLLPLGGVGDRRDVE